VDRDIPKSICLDAVGADAVAKPLQTTDCVSDVHIAITDFWIVARE
jgi:hypothetical protein